MARKRTAQRSANAPVPVVAIGASAGGIPALQSFFSAVPDEPGIAFVVVLHLSPSHESNLTNVVQRSSRLKVIQVDSDKAIEPDCVYVIPPNAVLTISDDRIQPEAPRSEFERRHPIDAIFRSLAKDRGERAMCVVLSGSGSNGAAGAQSVREVDGIVVAQDPESAGHSEMPRNVIMAGLADRVLVPEEMPPVLISYARSPPPREDRPAEELARKAEGEFNAILAILRTRGGHDFSPYKKSTLVRRISRRMGLSKVQSLAEYAERLRNDPDEVRALAADLLINVTGFFRDPEAWATLRQEAIAKIAAAGKPTQPVRAWVPACSTGEEAYSIAMLILEEAEHAEKRLDIKVFATDPEQQALARARMGLFPATVMEDEPRDLVRKYFDPEDELYRARKVLRDAVIFAPQNLLSDPPFSRLDLVSCRNLLIYLEQEIQDRVIALLHFALREGGYLFLGSSETIGRHKELFQPISKKWRIFRRVGPTRHELVDFPLLGSEHGLSAAHQRLPVARIPADEARDMLLSSFAPPAVLVDNRNRVLFIHGDLDGLLRPPAGEPTLDLFAMAREELRHRLRGAIRQAAADNGPVSVDATLTEGAKAGPVKMTVTPLQSRNAAPRYLVSFELGVRTAAPAAREAPAALDKTEAVERHLEHELRAAREELQMTVEQLESSNEELKASNEEITSMNEELQSTNEELETSKEELQSLNEELNTVNAQLQTKVEELEDRTNDLRNLLNSSDVATLFLDAKHCIRWFSPAVRDLFQIIHADIGRPITDFARRFHDPDFLDDADEVLRTLQPRQKEVPSEEGRWYLRRILPYRTEDNRIDGVVATFTDITDRRSREEELAASKAYAEEIVDTTRQPLVVLDKAMHVRTANRAFLETFSLPGDEVHGHLLFDLDDGGWNIPALRQALRQAMADSGVLNDLEFEHAFPRLGTRTLLVSARRIEGEELTLVALEDISGRKEAEERQRLLVAELHHRVQNLLAKISAIVSMSHTPDMTAAQFAAQLRDRIHAMGRTQELIGARSGEIDLRELVETELAGIRGDHAVTVEGPRVVLSASGAQALALALHELGTNALKYGAFSVPDGGVEVNWTVFDGKQGERLRLGWFESGVAIRDARRHGFGSELMERVVPWFLNGEGRLEFGKDGVRYLLEAPLGKHFTAAEG